ncbi:hypothetical protein GOP47_0014004 [Adiantum capillus-veneris]|uniref:Pentatricopeptide repeat-containing protein n=1 Tax=Adiantum capillus-veneris TaxID=13818 RepID=A0A9D4ZDR9_ADICA|nr:hypothetical protein GOP47_0014004 [Adiantum capillus-veneris]
MQEQSQDCGRTTLDKQWQGDLHAVMTPPVRCSGFGHSPINNRGCCCVVIAKAASPHLAAGADLLAWSESLHHIMQKYQSDEVFLSRMCHVLPSASMPCEDRKCVRQVHGLVNTFGSRDVPSVKAHLIQACGFCGSLDSANTAFHAISKKSVDTWNVNFAAYASHGDSKSALRLFIMKMQGEGLEPSTFALMCVIKLCTITGVLGAFEATDFMTRYGIPVSKNIINCLLQGCLKNRDVDAARHVRSLMVHAKLDSNAFLGDHLIRLFTECGSLGEADQVFRRITKPSIYTWTAIIWGHVKLGEPESALRLNYTMLQQGIAANNIVLLSMLKVFESLGMLEMGRLMHSQIVELELECNVLVGNTLVFMYAKCGSLEEGRKLFDKLPHRDLVSWGAMITGYVKCERALPALELYGKLKQEGVVPSKVIFLCTLKACTSIGSLTKGQHVHNHFVISGYVADVNIGSTLVDMYAKCGSLEEACKIFKDLPERTIVSWGAMIGGFAHHGHSVPALFLYDKMREQGIACNRVVFLSVMKTCASIGASEYSRLIHDHVVRSGIALDVVVGSTLVDMYAKCERPEAAQKVFHCLPEKNLVSWSAMIGAYTRAGKVVP